ncbi:MAG: NUDIX domain-containing protein [Candidatus Pacearchaeota archaeon]|jgi:(d)CTP diphosphatase
MKTLEVVAAVIEKDGKFLVAQKPSNHAVIPNKWEFPGGRTDGQAHNVALKRELREEMDGFEVDIERFLGKYTHSYDGKTMIELYAYLCYPKNEPRCLEHQKIAWVDPRNLLFYDMAHIDMEIVRTALVRKTQYPKSS